MKRMKKLLAVMLAAIMVMSMGTSVFAATGSVGTYTITITGATGHTYVAYQIFDGDYDSSGDLSNVAWGTDIDTSKIDGILNTLRTETVYSTYINDYLTDVSYSTSNDTSAAAVAKVLVGMNDDGDAITAFAELIATAITGTGTSSNESSGTYTIDVSSVGSGYYLVVDETTGTLANGDAISAYILKVAGQAQATAKVDVPTLTKTITNSDLTESGVTSTTQSTAGLDDTVKYSLTSKVPDTSDYTTYTFKVTDILSKGLTFNSSSMTVTVGSTPLTLVAAADVTTSTTNSYTLSTSIDSDGVTTIVVELVNFIASNYTEGASIVISYEATLNSNAVVGDTGNTNSAYLTYSNDPYSTAGGDGTGTTTTTTVTTYTTSLTITKIDGGLNTYTSDLDGITFTLKDSSGNTVGTAEVSSTNRGVLTFTDLAAGTYTLSEDVGSTGYSAISDLTVVLTYDTDNDEWVVGTSSASNLQVTDGIFTITVENNQGTELPTTGGIGTTMFYVVGMILVLGAAIVLVTRRRVGR